MLCGVYYVFACSEAHEGATLYPLPQGGTVFLMIIKWWVWPVMADDTQLLLSLPFTTATLPLG